MLADSPVPEFHLVIPSFEESSRLPGYLGDLVQVLGTRPYRTQILVVDDGSRSQEEGRLKEIVSRFAHSPAVAVQALFLGRNMGKGYAVRRGWQTAPSARWLAFADADGATPADEIARVFDIVVRSDDPRRCYFGSRVRMLGRSVERHWKRHIMGRAYATLVGLLIREPVYDSQCGFKVIPGRAFSAIQDVLCEDRFAFDGELIAALSLAGYRMQEIPVDWVDIPGSKVSLIKDSVRMTKSLFLIHGRKRRGFYQSGIRKDAVQPAGVPDGSR